MLLGYLNTRPRTTHMARVCNPNPALVSAGRREEWGHDPFSHGHEGEHHEGPGEPGHEGGGGEHADPALHTFRRLRGREAEDRGYLGSLSVLGDSVGRAVSDAAGAAVKGGLLA